MRGLDFNLLSCRVETALCFLFCGVETALCLLFCGVETAFVYIVLVVDYPKMVSNPVSILLPGYNAVFTRDV